MQPGWYDDPFAPGWLRWWDGRAWSVHQAPAQPVVYGMWQPTPEGDLATEERWARRARWSFIAIAAFGVAALVFAGPVLGHALRTMIDGCVDDPNTGVVTCNDGVANGWLLLAQVAAAVEVVPQLVMMTWLMHSARIGRRIGLPARRDPAWAFGFLLPIVNFWFPYQVARDSLPPGCSDRRVVRWWWGFSVAQTLVVLPVFIVAFFSVTAAVALAVVGSVVVIGAAVSGLRMVDAILAEHRRLLYRPVSSG